MTCLTPAPQPLHTFTEHDCGFVVRVLDIDGESWFVAKDIARILGYRDAANAARTLDVDERGTHKMSTPSGTQEMTIVSESGLYSLIIRSKKPEARCFRRWVTREVLPAIRKTGRYGRPVDLNSILAFLIEERQARIRFEENLSERLASARAMNGNGRPTLAETRARILGYVLKAGMPGLPRRVLSNRVRLAPERQHAIDSLLADGSILELVRERKHFYVSPSALGTE